jgi:hypothetical protein
LLKEQEDHLMPSDVFRGTALEGVMIGSDCADWWERHIQDFKRDLGDYVETHPGNFSILVATAGATLADLGDAFIVDPLRLGEGAAEGSWKGIVQDTFRVMSFIPPGRVFKMASGFARAGRAAEAVNAFRGVRGGLCAPIAIAQAIKTAGYKMAVGLADVAKALGVDLGVIEKLGTDPSLIGPALRKLGLLFDEIPKGPKSFGELAEMVRKSQSPLLISLETEAVEAGKVVTTGHRTMIVPTRSGVRIVDRAGAFESLEKLNQRYQRMFRLSAKNPFFLIKNAPFDESLIKLVNQYGVLACLARVSAAVLDFNKGSKPPGHVEKDFATFLKQRGKTPPLLQKDVLIQGGKAVVARHGDSLSGIAAREYGMWQLWPLLYDLNRQKIGSNPNRIQPGLSLLVLPIRRYTAKEIEAARSRAPHWRQ